MSLRIIEDVGSNDPLWPTYELAEMAERAGFHAIFLGHHHFTPPYSPTPFSVLGAIAARTSKIRLGTAIYLLPAYHPLEVAEAVATLDRISAGRVILGVGVGYRPDEYLPFGVPFEHRGSRMTESLRILPQAMSGMPVSFHGRHFHFDQVTVHPVPVQLPHPPIWVGALARRAQQRAAQLGNAWISDLLEPLSREVQLAARYRDYCAEAERVPSVVLMRAGAIAHRRETLEQQWLPGVMETHLNYWRVGARGRDEDGLYTKLERGDRIPLREFAANRLIAGTPDDCTSQIRSWQAAIEPDHLLISLSGTDLGLKGARDAIRLFGEEVLPNVV